MTDTAGESASNDALERVCPECGYDLRAIPSDRCPECGQAIDRTTLSVSRIPWTHRKQIGRARAYCRTNLLVIFRSKRLPEEIARPVSFADAQRFRHVTVLLAWLPLATWAAGLVLANWDDATADLRSPESRLAWEMEAASLVSLLFALWFALLLISGTASYFFHPRSLSIAHQDRAIALSYYSSAPLAWAWVPAALLGVLAWMSYQEWAQRGFGDKMATLVGCAAFGSVVAIVLLCWLRVVRLMQRVTHCGVGRTIAMTLCLPFSWAICCAVALLIPLTLIYVSLVILSFR